MPILKLILNLGLLSAFVIAPAFFTLGMWYRKSFSRMLMIWRRPEAIMATFVFFILGMILSIVAISCLFNYFKYPGLTPNGIPTDKLKEVALICFSFFWALTILFFVARMLMVQIITEEGIVKNHTIFKIPLAHKVIRWENFTDYYITNDYPNVVFTIIYKSAEEFTFKRTTIPAPAHLQPHLKALLDAKLDGDYSVSFPRGKRKHS